MSVRNVALSALKWSILAEVVSRVAGPLVFLILTKILSPSDYGVVAAATVLVSFSQIFSDAGLAKALIQRKIQSIDVEANVVFWCNSILAFVIYALLCFFSKEISHFFNEPAIFNVVPIVAMQLVLSSLGSVHTALLQKNLEFKKLFVVRSVASFVPGVLSIPFALNGYGYWALVAGSVFGQSVQCIMLWKMSPWRPGFRFDPLVAVEMISFGKWVALSGVFGWFYGWADTLVVGHYLGSYDMGLYRTGNTLVLMVFGLLFSPLLPVLYSLFSKKAAGRESLTESVQYVLHATALVSIPIGALLFLSSNDIANLLFGNKWVGIGLVVGMLGFVHSVGALVSCSGEVFRAKGLPHFESIVMGGTIVLYSIGYLYSVKEGMVVFLSARLLLVLMSVIPHLFFLRAALKLKLESFIFPVLKSALCALISAILVYIWLGIKYESIYIFVFRSFVFCLIYVVCIILIDGKFVKFIANEFVNKRNIK